MIGKTLREQRLKMDVTLTWLAKRANLSQPFLSNIENENQYPTVDTFFKIVNTLCSSKNITPEVQEYFSDLGEYGKLQNYQQRIFFNPYDDFESRSEVEKDMFNFWYQELMNKILSNIEHPSLFPENPNDENESISVYFALKDQTISKKEREIVDVIESLLDHNTGNFNVYDKKPEDKSNNKTTFSTSMMSSNPEWVKNVLSELTEKQNMQISKIFHIFSILPDTSKDELLNYAEYLSVKRLNGELQFGDDLNSAINYDD